MNLLRELVPAGSSQKSPQMAVRSEPHQPRCFRAPQAVQKQRSQTGFGDYSVVSVAVDPTDLVAWRASRCRAPIPEQRRSLLLALAAALSVPTGKALAGFGWDGSSAALGSCALGEEGDECRVNSIKRDSLKGAGYADTVKGNLGRPSENTFGIPVAEMADAYSKETLALSELVQKYATLDTTDPERTKVVKLLRKDGSAWVSKYARGGSARKLSARRFYIAIDALQGHLASNGFAPYPRNKLAVLLDNVEQATSLVAQGK